jgi:hypothetical protein
MDAVIRREFGALLPEEICQQIELYALRVPSRSLRGGRAKNSALDELASFWRRSGNGRRGRARALQHRQPLGRPSPMPNREAEDRPDQPRARVSADKHLHRGRGACLEKRPPRSAPNEVGATDEAFRHLLRSSHSAAGAAEDRPAL